MTGKITSKGAVIVTAVAILLYGIVAGIRGITNVFTPEIANATGLSYGTVSSIFAVRSLVFAISVFSFGLLTQKIAIRHLLAAGAGLVAIGLAGAAFSSQYILLLLFLGIFVGIGAGSLCYAIVYAAAAPLLGKQEAGVCAGIISSSQGMFCILLTPFVQSLGSTAAGLTACFLILGAVTACLVPLSIFFFRKRRNEEAEQIAAEEKTSRLILAPLKYMVKRPYFYMLALGTATYGLCDGGMINHLYEKALIFSATPDFAKYLVMLYGFALIVGPILGGIIAARVKNLQFLFASLIGIWLLLCTSVYYFPMTEAAGILIVTGMGITASMMVPTFCLLTQEKSPGSLFSSIFPIIMIFEYIALSFDAFFGGFCFDTFGNFNLSMLITYLMCGIVIVLFLISGVKDRKKQSE